MNFLLLHFTEVDTIIIVAADIHLVKKGLLNMVTNYSLLMKRIELKIYHGMEKERDVGD